MLKRDFSNIFSTLLNKCVVKLLNSDVKLKDS